MIRPRALRSARARLLAVASLTVLALAGCSLVSGPGPSQPSSSSGASSSRPSSSSPPAKARLVVDHGFTTLSTLPEPLASVEHEEPDILERSTTSHRFRDDLVQVRRQDDVVRVVVAVLNPAGGG